MRILVHNTYNEMNINENMFSSKLSQKYEDNLSHLVYFKQKCHELGHQVGTSCSMELDSADIIVFLDYPNRNDSFFRKAIYSQARKYLVVTEPKLVNKNNYQEDKIKIFDSVFSFTHEIPAKKLIPLGYRFNIKRSFNPSYDNRSGVAMIAANKKFSGDGELYSERKKIIDWYSNNFKADFHLYGRDWNYYRFDYNGPFNFLNRFNFKKIKSNKEFMDIYKGQIDSKRRVLSNHIASFCFENSANEYGYITEKIFDSMFSGCIPIYYGAPDVKNYIPESCYVDYLNFRDITELHNYVVSIKRVEYDSYMKNIKIFLNSKAMQFRHENFFDTIIENVKL